VAFFFFAQAAPCVRRIDSGPNWSKAKHRPGKWLVTYSIRSSFASRCGSVDSFQVLARWKEMPRECKIWRSRSRAIATTGVPDADAMMITARRTRIDPCLPRRTMSCSRLPS
jgi:hypothetical protein